MTDGDRTTSAAFLPPGDTHSSSARIVEQTAEYRWAAVNDALTNTVENERVPGATVAILLDGQWRVAWHGVDDVRDRRPRTEASRSHTACLNKVLIAYAALILVDKGLITLDGPVSAVLPQTVRRRGGTTVEITLRQLLSHTSGIDESFEEWAFSEAMDTQRLIRRFERYPQIAGPGEIFAYSDAGTALVTQLVEQVTGQLWREAVTTLLLAPLGVTPLPSTSTAAEVYGATMSTGHRWDEDSGSYQAIDEPEPPPELDTLGERSAGFSVSELAILAEFALHDGVMRDGRRLLSAPLAEQMRAHQVAVPRHHLIHSWGLGWLHFDEQSFGFEASSVGHQTFVQMFPQQQMALIVMANAYPALVLYYGVLHALQGGGSAWWDRPPQSVDAQLCVGHYASDGCRLEIIRINRKLRYRFFERAGNDSWDQVEAGDLVPAGTGGFSGRSGQKTLRRSISPIWSGSGRYPTYFRFAQRLMRRVEP